MSAPELQNKHQNDNVNDVSSNRYGWAFIGLSIFLVALCVGWPIFTDWVGLVLQKEPVPWPVGVKVSKKTFQNVSFPNKLGSYKLLEEDGVLFTTEKDGKPDGVLEFKKDELETLGVGTSLDEIRYDDRSSNWYLSRIYVDQNPKSKVGFWKLDLVYYTGNADKVPHVPENCGEKSGNTLDYLDYIVLKDLLPGKKWSDFTIKHVGLENNLNRRKTSVFYFFTTNGLPQNDRINVRSELLLPYNKYVFFAKVSVTPMPIKPGFMPTKKQIQQEAQHFFKVALPVIMKQFPTTETIKQLENKKS